MTVDEIAVHLKNATYAGDGAEGICLVSDRYAIKFWWAKDVFDSSFDVWEGYRLWPDSVKEAVVPLYFCGDYGGRPVTVTERVAVIEDREHQVVPSHVVKALDWFCETYGYHLDDMVAMPNLGWYEGRVVLFDIL